MPALDFPASPTNGQAYGAYIYDSSLPGWRSKGGAVAATYVSDTAPSGAVKGDMWYRSTDGTTYVYVVDVDTSQWVEIRSEISLSRVGLVPVVPTSVAVGSGSASVDSTGLIFFSGATSISVNGCFSAAYRNYRVILTDLQANNPNYPGITLRLRASGTDASSEYWSWGVRAVSSAGITQRGSNSTSGIEVVSTIGWGGKYAAVNTDINTPFIASNTTVIGGAVGFDASSALWQNQYCFKNDSTSYDGLTFFTSAGNFTGNMKIYGYN